VATTAPIDVERARAETPGCANVAHLNNAGSSLPPTPVLEAVLSHLRRESEIGGYEAEDEAADRLDAAYDSIARLIGCDRDEVAVIENATRAWDMAFYGFHFEPGDRILTGRAEYASNYIALSQVAAQTGAEVELVPDDEDGCMDVAALERMLDERVKLVSLVHVPTQSGLVNPAADVGRVTRAAGVPLLLDACQSAGQLPLDVDELGCDVLSATGRKFLRGPRGTGFLYVRRGLLEHLEPPFLDGHAAVWQEDGGYRIRDDARRFENWESFVAGKIGLGAAVEYALDLGLEPIRDRVQELAAELLGRLREAPGVTVRDRGRELAAIVTFTRDGYSAQEIKAALAAARVNVTVSDAGWSRLDLGHRGLDAVVRASVHYFNDDDELDRLVGVVASL
jgi:cysteine desulfurase / selenocysteine lyase